MALISVAAALFAASAWARIPVAKITDFAGLVEISSDGKQWRPVLRAKLLFVGGQVRTGKDGRATLIAEADNAALEMHANTLVEVQDKTLRVVSGQAETPRANSGLFGFFADLGRRWESRQRYTTVRRGVTTAWEVETASAITASDDYPYLVWQNGGSDVSYRVTVDGKARTVPAAEASAPYVRFALVNVAPGEHSFRIEVLDAAGAVKYVGRNVGQLTWLTTAESHALKAQHTALLNDRTKDDEEIAEFLTNNGLLVPAMEHYRSYFKNNPADSDMLPGLLKLYSSLRLDVLRQQEASSYQRLAAQ